MLTKTFKIWHKPGYRKVICCLLALVILPVANAHNTPQTTVSTKEIAPVSVYYQWFMFVLAVVYALFLVVRARRRKSKSRTPQL